MGGGVIGGGGRFTQCTVVCPVQSALAPNQVEDVTETERVGEEDGRVSEVSCAVHVRALECGCTWHVHGPARRCGRAGRMTTTCMNQ